MRFLDNEATKLVHNEALFDMAQRHINETYSNDDLMKAIANAPANHWFDAGTMPFDAVTELYDEVIIESHGWHGEYWIRTDMDEVMDELQCFFLDNMDYNLRDGVAVPYVPPTLCTSGMHEPHVYADCGSCRIWCEDPDA